MKRYLAMILGCSTALFILGCKGSEPTPLEIGDVVPDFDLPAVSPAAMKLTSDDLRGKITVLNFWSTTCAICLKETEDLGRIHDGGKALVVGIALDKDADYLGRFVKERGIRYTVAMADEELFSRYDGYAIPYTLVLDRSRAIRRKVYGRIESDELAKLIDEIDRSSVTLGAAGPIPSPR